jgi:hypothetical protein
MRQLKQNVVLVAGGAVLLAGIAVLALLRLAAVVIPAVLAVLVIELGRAFCCMSRAPALFWRSSRTTKDHIA